MGKLAFVFSGQGAHHTGMGRELCEKAPAAAEIFRRADALRPGTSKQCFWGSDEELSVTKNTQPCLFAMELAAANVLFDKGVRPEALAGFSLGEVTAATAAGIFDNETGFRLVCKRGELMQTEAEKFDTSMAAVVKLTPEQVQDVCAKYSDVYPVNFNCPGQITVSGLASQMKDFSADVKAAGGRALPLKLKGAFHSPFMNAASEAFRVELENAKINKGNITLYSDLTSMPYTDDVAELLSKQICSPVLWEKIVRNMIADGFDTFIEIGPGRTLTNMIKKISADVKAQTVEEYLSEVE